MRRKSVLVKWSGRLATATDRDFERKVLPFLRLFWLPLQQVPPRGPWDAKGIDLLVWVENRPFPCVVQCKGYQVQGLTYKQIYEAEKSIEKFLKSDVSCEVYLFVHNRDGRNQKFNKRITQRLGELVSNGKAKKAELWDRQILLNRAFDRMKEIQEEALRRYSKRQLSHFQELFNFGRIYIPKVPVTEKKLIFKRWEPCSEEMIHPLALHDVSKIILSPSEVRWTLLSGRFGTGKTTAALYAATSSDRVVIFIPCADLPSSHLKTGTSKLLEQVAKSLNVLDNFEAQDQEVLNELAGSVLAHLLQHPHAPYTLIFDGLDENRVYANLEGLQRLSNQLADLTCPIIMTAREEHLNAMFGNFSLAFYEFSTKKGPRRHARWFKLGRWGKKQVRQFATRALRKVTGNQKKHLFEFLALLNNGEYVHLYGELPSNPLFLQFILEDVATHGVRWANRCLLLRSWIEHKIRRDRGTQRITLKSSLDTEDFVARMILLMENIANSMTSKADGQYELSEFIDSVHVQKEAEKIFKISSAPILAILLNSVMVSQSQHQMSNLKVTFAFRIFHEYFLACYLVRKNLPDTDYPNTVRSLYLEIGSCLDTA